MKRLYSAAALAALILVLVSIPAVSRTKTMTWKGWISDSACGAKGAAASHKDCALACVHQKGAKFVFVNSADKSVYAIANQPEVKDGDVGQEVKLTGKMLKNKSIEVTSIAPSM
ncbi:MAG: hypothetical protein ACRD3T_10435 [Terriglobia bacterium]